MKRIEESKIEEIKNKNDIVDVISNYLSLIKKGKNYVSLCPFHDDSNPSMVISQEKQIYKCFSCDAGGNVISFVQNYEKISFVEALQKLAAQAGVELDVINFNSTVQVDETLQQYYRLTDEATNLYQYFINENQDELVSKYIEDRQLSEELLKVFKIGYSSRQDVLSALFKSKGYDLNQAVAIGLLLIKDNEYHDTYKNRIIYPIIDINDNVLGYTCRALGEGLPKYINSIESKMFNKSEILYNINNAKDTIRKTKTVYVLEGAHDTIAMYRAGFKNAVSVMGTALTKEHLNLLRRLGTTEIILGFDGDEAGQKATAHAIKLATEAKFSTKYLNFEHYDPDEYLKKYGIQKLIELVNKPLSAIEFKINYDFSQVNIANYQDKKNVVINIVNDLNDILDEFDKEYYYSYLANLSGISYELISSFANEVVKVPKRFDTKPIAPMVSATSSRTDLENASINILYYVMNDKKYFDIFNEAIGSFINSNYRRLYNVVAAHYLANSLFKVSDLDEGKVDQEVIAQLLKILLSYDYETYNDEEVFFDSIATLKLEGSYLELEQLEEELVKVDDPTHKAKISSDILRLSDQIKQAKILKFNR